MPHVVELLVALNVVVTGVILGCQVFDSVRNPVMIAFAGCAFALSIAAVAWILLNTDDEHARQSADMLKLARQTLACLQGGMDDKAAMKICELLLPNTAAVAVAITDKERLLGYAGFEGYEGNPAGMIIRAASTHQAIQQDALLILTNEEDVAFLGAPKMVKAAIVAPLRISTRVEGTLKFYYRKASQINATQTALADGYAHLLSTQMASEALEEQTQLATQMSLKALQNQINPHFLFNTINTIASLCRTNPMRARELLREFAAFYRQTLEDSDGLIMLSREVEQVSRYFHFELARFGEERLALFLGESEGVQDMLVPPFIIQPLVENSVRHAMPSEGLLSIYIDAEINEDGNLVIAVFDDGVGMSEETCANIMHPESSTGMGIAVKNVHDRVMGYFGPRSEMRVESTLGEGTRITLVLDNSNLTENYRVDAL